MEVHGEFQKQTLSRFFSNRSIIFVETNPSFNFHYPTQKKITWLVLKKICEDVISIEKWWIFHLAMLVFGECNRSSFNVD